MVRLLRRIVLLGLLVAVAAAAGALAVARPWQSGTHDEELTVERATLRPGRIQLILLNGSEEVARVAQVIVNDAYVDFRASVASVRPHRAGSITVLYPWIRGESYEIELLLSPEGAVEYEIEDAAAGSRSAESV